MAERDVAWYVYCVVGRDEQPPLDELTGVDGRPVTTIAEGELCALASTVPLAVFGEEALRGNLEEIAWVERTARAHDAVLAHALGSAAVLPLRMCTVFTDAEHVRAPLRHDRAALAATLRRLRGHREWSVKARVDMPALEALLGETPTVASRQPAEAGSGRAFFDRKRSARTSQQRAFARATLVADEIHDQLSAEAAAARLLPPQRRDLSGLPDTMILNGAYLVKREQDAAFAAAVSALAARHRASGFLIDVSGPWAPYNFASIGDPSDERRAPEPGHAA